MKASVTQKEGVGKEGLSSGGAYSCTLNHSAQVRRRTHTRSWTHSIHTYTYQHAHHRSGELSHMKGNAFERAPSTQKISGADTQSIEAGKTQTLSPKNGEKNDCYGSHSPVYVVIHPNWAVNIDLKCKSKDF